MEKDTTFENFLNFSSFANSFEDVEFLDLRNVKDGIHTNESFKND